MAETRIVRNCTYNPTESMINLNYVIDGQEITEKYLEVKYRVQWFNEYLSENNLDGFIDDSEVTYLPDAHMLKAVATVYIDGKIVGKSAAGMNYDASDPNRNITAVQTVCTQAKGRALANAGFGTINCAVEAGSDAIPCDAGIPIDSQTMGVDNAPIEARNVPTPQPEKTGMTVDEARRFVLPIGKYKGKTIAEAMTLDAEYVKFFISDRFDAQNKYSKLKEAVAVALG